MFLVGGGPATTPGQAYDEFVAAARARGGDRIAVALLGSQDEAAGNLDMYADPITERFPEALIEPVWLIDEDEGAIVWPESPENLAGIVVAGGWTPGYLDALAQQRELLVRLVRSGIPYLGYSAGAAITARHAVVGGWKHQGRQVAPELAGEGSTEMVIRDGLGLIGPAVETHADTHSIVTRAIAALQIGPMSSVVAIDEGTCLAIDTSSGRTAIVGQGQVTWVTREGDSFLVRPEPGTAAAQ